MEETRIADIIYGRIHQNVYKKKNLILGKIRKENNKKI